jgi:peptide-methionine (S)-S-oxide reductase
MAMTGCRRWGLGLGGWILLCAIGVAGAAGQEPPRQDEGTPARAIFAGGCFWCMEPPFDELNGVMSTTSGYIGGQTKNPTYQQVSTGRTGHTEAVEVLYDPRKITYEQLLEVFWRNIDPTDGNGQFCDRGSQYRPGIFYTDDQQRRLAAESKARLEASGRFKRPLPVEITAASVFYRAEEYHQDYYRKNPLRYKYYRFGCGRDRRLEQIWGKPAKGTSP